MNANKAMVEEKAWKSQQDGIIFCIVKVWREKSRIGKMKSQSIKRGLNLSTIRKEKSQQMQLKHQLKLKLISIRTMINLSRLLSLQMKNYIQKNQKTKQGIIKMQDNGNSNTQRIWWKEINSNLNLLNNHLKIQRSSLCQQLNVPHQQRLDCHQLSTLINELYILYFY